jgi:hypothetical protein
MYDSIASPMSGSWATMVSARAISMKSKPSRGA